MAFIDLVGSSEKMIVDDHLEHVFNHFKWRIDNGYGRAMITRSKIYAHQFVIGKAESGLVIDHINRNKLDNRVLNLRKCTNNQNFYNAKKRRNKTTLFKGVSVKRDKFHARIMLNRKTYLLGDYTNQEDAARAYDKKAYELFGEFAHLNFPDELKNKEAS